VFVQVAALDSEAAAEPVADRARRMNYPVVVVKEGPWYKVRVGPFGNRTDANAALRRVQETLGGQPFIVTVR
jgi:cell division septation protein DedD